MGKIKKEKIPKTSHEKKIKTCETKKKKTGEKKKCSIDDGTRKYGYISAKSVITMAESAGISGLQEEVAKTLAEDVTYRLRYIIQQCKKYTIHSKRNKLNCSDVNEVLKMCDAPIIYGYTVDEPLHNFIFVKEAEVFVIEDNLIDLPAWTLNEIKVHFKTPQFTTGGWLRSDETMHEVKVKNEGARANINLLNASSPADCFKQGNNSSSQLEFQKYNSNDNDRTETKIPTNLIKYYGITCNTILGHADLKVAFQDLSQNSRILPIVPYLLNFITIALNKLGSERQIRRLLQTIEALSKNTSIDFTPYSATTRVINAMLLIVAMDKKPSKFSCNFRLRSYAARVLALVLSQWCTRDEQRLSIDKKLGKLLSDFKASPKVHYGAIALLTAMGPEAVSNNLCNNFSRYAVYLNELKQVSHDCYNEDVAMLEEVILVAITSVLRNPQTKYNKLTEELYVCLYSYFGDALCSLWNPPPNRMHQRDKRRFASVRSEIKCCKMLKLLSAPSKPVKKKLLLESVFRLTKMGAKKNLNIVFKFAGGTPVPEVNLKRRKLETVSESSQFTPGRESKDHGFIAGKYFHSGTAVSQLKTMKTFLPVGGLHSIL